MKRLFICIVSILLILSVLASCSKDKATDNGPTPTPSSVALVGTWERITTKADGVVITEDNDQWNVYEDEVLIFRADKTGLQSCSHGTQVMVSWYLDGDYIVVSGEEDGVQRILYALQGDTLSLFYPPGGGSSFPDLEYIYTRM